MKKKYIYFTISLGTLHKRFWISSDWNVYFTVIKHDIFQQTRWSYGISHSVRIIIGTINQKHACAVSLRDHVGLMKNKIYKVLVTWYFRLRLLGKRRINDTTKCTDRKSIGRSIGHNIIPRPIVSGPEIYLYQKVAVNLVSRGIECRKRRR